MTSRLQLRVLITLALAWACGGDSTAPLGPTTFDVSGDWYWEETVADQNAGVACFDSGGIIVVQDGPRFTARGLQTGLCSSVGGSVEFSDSFTVTQGTIDGATARFRVDPCPYVGTLHGTLPDSLTGTVTCTVRQQGVTLRVTGTWRYLRERPDWFPPQINGAVTGSFTPNIFLLGDSLRITVNATDEKDLRFIGYRVAGPVPLADSIPVSGLVATHQFAPPVTAAMAGSSIVSVFARDKDHVQTLQIDTVLAVAVRGRLARTVTLPSAVSDAVYDTKRGRLYLSMFLQDKIAVLDPATATLDSLITPPGIARGLDLTLGGDSLLVALANRGAFAVISLLSGAIDTIHIDFDTTLLHSPGSLKMTADGKVFVTGTQSGISGFAGQLMAIDLAGGTQQRRTDVGITVNTTNGIIDTGTLLARARDRSRLLLLQVGACCPVKGWMYVSGSNQFGPETGTVGFYTSSITPSLNGSKFLIGNQLFNGDLSPAGSVSDPDAGFGPTTLSADAATAYLTTSIGTFPGFVTRRTSDNALLERSYVPNWGQDKDHLLLLPDGLTLIAYIGTGQSPPVGTTLYIIDLH